MRFITLPKFSPGWIKPASTVAGTSYANPLGSGDRRVAAITVTQNGGLVNGSLSALVDQSGAPINDFNSATVDSTVWLKFDFSSSLVIDHVQLWQSNSNSHGDWKWQGSNDNSAWTDIGSSFTLGGSTLQGITTLSGNSTAYRYYRLLGVSGSTSSSPFIYEFWFRRPGFVQVFAVDGLPAGSGSAWVDGNTSDNTSYFNSVTVDGTVWLLFDFGSSKVADEAKFYQENTSTHGDWQWQGSNDNSSWTNIGSSFTLGGSATQTMTTLNGNTTAYRYYRLLGVSGATSSSPYIHEFEFKVGA